MGASLMSVAVCHLRGLLPTHAPFSSSLGAVRLIRFLRAHLDSVVALLLSVAYLAEVSLSERPVSGEPIIAALPIDETNAIVAGAAFLLSLGLRSRLPLVPLGLAYVALVLSGAAALDSNMALLVGLVLAVYSVGAWAGGRAGQVGAVGVGGLLGLAVLRVSTGVAEPRDIAAAVVLLGGAWAVGLAVRSLRAGRGDERVVGEVDWEAEAAVSDWTGRDETVRELRDVVERAMSAVILQARTAQASLGRDPASARRSLSVIEAAGNDALVETQRLTGLLLSPDGMPLPELSPGLDDLDYLAEQVTQAGLPVAVRIEGRPVPMTPDLDGVAYRVVHEALMSTLETATSAQSNVVVRYLPDELQVEVVDDGIAATPEADEEETAGLLAVRDEVARLGGTLDAGPGEDRGYWVLARLPYEPDEWE